MKSYLSERLQCVKSRERVTDFKKFPCGVSQGSVVGPLLFLMYTNGIYKLGPIAAFYLFADGTTLFCGNKNINQLKNNIKGTLMQI